MTSDAEVIEETKQAFSTASRPEHFADFTHCEECQEHDELLRSRDLQTLAVENTRQERLVPEGCYDELQRAIELWDLA